MQCLPLLWDLTICVLCDPQIWWYFINPPNMPTEKKIRTKIIIYIPTFVHSGLPWVNHSFIIERFPYIDIFVFSTQSLNVGAGKDRSLSEGKTFLKTFWEGRDFFENSLRGQKLKMDFILDVQTILAAAFVVIVVFLILIQVSFSPPVIMFTISSSYPP